MNGISLLTAAFLVFFPYASSMEPNGSLRMNIARWAESRGNDLRRIVRKLDNSQIRIEPNEPYVVHRKGKPLSKHVTSEQVWSEMFKENGTHTFSHMFTKKLTTTWTWSRQHNLDYVLNVAQPVKDKVPDNSQVRIESLHKHKDFWEYQDPLSWEEAKDTCRAAGLKLAQPKTRKEVEHLQKVLHSKLHNRESGCLNESWKKFNGYCFFYDEGYNQRQDAVELCNSMNSTLPLPSLGDAEVWKQAVADYMISIDKKSIDVHAGAFQAPDGQWMWDHDGTNVPDDIWSSGESDGEDECSTLDFDSGTGKLHDRGCENVYRTVCQGYASNHWLGALGSDETKCVEWVNGKCIEKEDNDPKSNIQDLWRTGQPGDSISSDYALLLQIEHGKPFTLMKTTEKRPFLCESACPLGFVNMGPKCLLVQKVWLTWREAQSECIKNGLNLYETNDTTSIAEFLRIQKARGTYWIGGSEGSFVRGFSIQPRKELDMNKIKKLQFICELSDGTRKMNVTNQLSYKDQEKVRLPKVVTTTNDCNVTVKEKTIAETYPFSVQMDITGWIWVLYSSPSDEHGGYTCDKNNDWVSGEFCWAHSKWGYSTSYLHDGDQIIAQGDNARMTLNGTVTYIYNEYEVSTCESDRESRSVSERKLGRRSKRSIEATKKKTKNYEDKTYDIEDDSKPLMSGIGKRAADWVRALAQEKNAHLVAYTLDQLSPTVTDFKLEKEFSGLTSPSSIFEEEFENRGSDDVITTFAKIKNVVNSYRWSVSKGLSIEDAHVTSFSKTNSQSVSNTFSLSNNIALTEGSTQSNSHDTTNSEITSEGGSETESVGTVNTETNNESKDTSKGETTSTGTTHTQSDGSSDGSTATGSIVSTSGEAITTGQSDSQSTGSAVSSGTTQESGNTQIQSGSETNSNTNTDTSSHGSTQSQSQSSTNSQSNTKTKTDSSTNSVGGSVTAEASVSGGGFGVSVSASLSATVNTNHESTNTEENSSTNTNENTSTKDTSINSETSTSNEVSSSSETGHSNEHSNTAGSNTNNETTTGNEMTQNNETTSNNETSKTNETSSTSETTSNTEKGSSIDNTITTDSTHATEIGSSAESSINKEKNKNYDSTLEEETRFSSDSSKNQEKQKTVENTQGSDKSKDSQISQERQKTRTQSLNLDRNEEVETTEEETLETTNEVTIPPNTRVKIEWRVEKRTVRLPWKATVHLTGWINVRLKNKDQVCDIYNPISGWNSIYDNTCEKDNRLYGYPLSVLTDKNYIQKGDGLRFITSGMFEGVGVTSHYLRVTETQLDDNGARNLDYNDNEDNYDYNDYSDFSRRKRNVRSPRPKVTDYHLKFDENGNGQVNMGNNNRYFRRFHAKKNFKKNY